MLKKSPTHIKFTKISKKQTQKGRTELHSYWSNSWALH